MGNTVIKPSLPDCSPDTIDHGLARSRFGIVILNSHFLRKRWPEDELNDLATREANGKKVILPIWHKIGFQEVLECSPILADESQ